MESISNAIESFILPLGFERAYSVAYSGGLDSHVLLHALAVLRQRYPLRLHAVHIHHGLSPNADAWAEHCDRICAQLKIEFSVHRIAISGSEGRSLEEVARERRYQKMAEYLPQKGVLLTAHHQNDQAETLLLQLLRGAGPQGLAAMPSIRSFAEGQLGRPLLGVGRGSLLEYAKKHQLIWIEDESNENVSFTRNFLRHEVMPLLESRWPSITESLSRSARHCAEMQQVITDLAQQDLLMVIGQTPDQISIKKLLLLNVPRQKQVLRAWLQQQGCSLPSAAKMEQILTRVLPAEQDKLPYLIWGNIELRRYRDHLFVMPCLDKEVATQEWDWNLCDELVLPGIGLLQAVECEGQGLRSDIASVTVRFRRGGEKCRLPGRSHHHELKKLLQRWGVPTWLRDRTPLIYAGGMLVAIPGFFVAEEVMAARGAMGRIIYLHKEST